MTTSGVVGGFNLTADQVISMAFRKCGVSPSEIAGDMQTNALDSLELILKSLSNDGYDRWLQENVIVGLVPNTYEYQLPLGTVEVTGLGKRSCQWPLVGGTPFSSSGIAANAFDDTLTNVCQQTSPNGNIGYNFTTANPAPQNVVSYWGICPFNPGGTVTYNLVFEYSNDGIVYFPLSSPGSATYTDNQWTFYELTNQVAAQYYRVRETGGATLALRSLFLGVNPTDIVIGRFNKDGYQSFPQKQSQGDAPVQYKVNETPTGMFLQVWPVPNDGFNQLYLLTYRQPQDVGALTNTLDLPYRWQKPIIALLAYEIANYVTPPLQEAKMMRLQQDAQREVMAANMTDNDRSNVRISTDMQRYFRR